MLINPPARAAEASEEQWNKFVVALTDKTVFLSGPDLTNCWRSQPCSAEKENNCKTLRSLCICSRISSSALTNTGVCHSSGLIFQQVGPDLRPQRWQQPSEEKVLLQHQQLCSKEFVLCSGAELSDEDIHLHQVEQDTSRWRHANSFIPLRWSDTDEGSCCGRLDCYSAQHKIAFRFVCVCECVCVHDGWDCRSVNKKRTKRKIFFLSWRTTFSAHSSPSQVVDFSYCDVPFFFTGTSFAPTEQELLSHKPPVQEVELNYSVLYFPSGGSDWHVFLYAKQFVWKWKQKCRFVFELKSALKLFAFLCKKNN